MDDGVVALACNHVTQRNIKILGDSFEHLFGNLFNFTLNGILELLAAFDEQCTRDDECDPRATMVCRRGKCVCNNISWLDENDKKCYLGHLAPCNETTKPYCTRPLECIENKCNCPVLGAVFVEKNCYDESGFGEPCQDDMNCYLLGSGPEQAVCKEEICTCNEEKWFFPLLQKCVPGSEIDDKCDKDTPCIPDEAMECSSEGKCRCKDGFKDQKHCSGASEITGTVYLLLTSFFPHAWFSWLT
ncbi:unnamed protein product [Darwinula stevensoni]|uniref:EGF-like domain-containing protein n=1 Tax=Darwinula stevensoni TaxID=69355 RepID=A0A7R9FSI7_9CRUS|nr:unnamed protein product [Darwinula stevensoni]CAG0903589.1 unnamed protein product [Darwinula stevensoni]